MIYIGSCVKAAPATRLIVNWVGGGCHPCRAYEWYVQRGQCSAGPTSCSLVARRSANSATPSCFVEWRADESTTPARLSAHDAGVGSAGCPTSGALDDEEEEEGGES
eukprot:5017600-Pyramimonas_sp.AAC.1